MDPPFGGRVEPLADTVNAIITEYQKSTEDKLPVFWVFPYFMEPHLLNSLPELVMLDYKVDYDNHPLFTKDQKGRKYGSPVRIFTNVDSKYVIFSACRIILWRSLVLFLQVDCIASRAGI